MPKLTIVMVNIISAIEKIAIKSINNLFTYLAIFQKSAHKKPIYEFVLSEFVD